MTSRFYLKSWSIGFEIPFKEDGFSNGIPELRQDLVDSYLNWFDVLSVEIPYLELPNGNMMILFTLTVRCDPDLVNSNENWDEMKTNIEESFIKFLKSNNVTIYQTTYAQ